MNILTVQKTIPVRTTWIDGEQKQIKSVVYDVTYSLRTELNLILITIGNLLAPMFLISLCNYAYLETTNILTTIN